MSVGASAIVLVIVLVIKARNSVIEHQRAFARIELSEIGERLRRYYLDFGYYPTTDQGLDFLLASEAIDAGIFRPSLPHRARRKLLDPWGHPFQYESDGDSYVLKSLGPHRDEGKSETDSDLTITGGQ